MPTLDDFFASHTELRGAVEFALKRIQQIGGDNDPAIPVLDAALKDARVTATAFAEDLRRQDRDLAAEEYSPDAD